MKEAYQKILYLPRPRSNRYPMAVERRAKQFAPFAALKGFESKIQEKEVIYRGRKILPDDKREELDRIYRALREGMAIAVEYFSANPYWPDEGQYKTTEGKVQSITEAFIQVNDRDIKLSDISNIVFTDKKLD
ncbi:2'-5' RNA ligase family protein [Ruminococcus sp. CLA-AA-H200]|uniref:2'-5' RNA ligase family protein n=1 Tax=Ruminococcus turbiniformis TaxID=2881258 RepID=A0ABS8G0W5_9FIRM|nr:2'-5' RNA ligase family protein [Ruminococcus turbiniformis]MCC2255957.1 2'-5' RNA ligase family protein [Ruminococcus turbiniformis]